MRPFLALALFMFSSVAPAAQCTARSGAQVTPVVELYTSEGCSSCPPAERWLSSLGAQAAAGRVVPLAFHVNYWDYIGWKDPFASEQATRRQREIQAAAGARYVYTPQVVVGGRDFRGWPSGAPAAFDAIRRKAAPATIELAVKAEAATGIEVRSRVLPAPGLRGDGWVVVVAATQDGLSSRVTAGENRGEHLAHDFVVRDFATHRGGGERTSSFRPAHAWNLARMSVAAFLQDARSGEVLQSVSCRLGP